MEVLIVAWVIYGSIFGAFCAFVAGTKNRSSGAWFILGFFFGIFALLAVGLSAAAPPPVAPRIPTGDGLSWATLKASLIPTLKKCPRCAEEVKYEAVTCRFCGHEFGEVPPPSPDLAGIRFDVSPTFGGGVREIISSEVTALTVGRLVGIELPTPKNPTVKLRPVYVSVNAETVSMTDSPREWPIPPDTSLKRDATSLYLVGPTGVVAQLTPVAGPTDLLLPAVTGA